MSAARVRAEEPEEEEEAPVPKKRRSNDYFPDDEPKPRLFVPTGSILLDCVTGKGWPLGRVSNVVGDKSTGKTLLAIEAAANFARKFPKGKVYYREAEAAFDVDYAKFVGLPVDKVDFGPQGIDTHWDTVDSIIEDVLACTERGKKLGQESFYIIDSLDALASKAELNRKVGEGSYNMEKPKLMGELFRKHIRDIRSAEMGLFIISQVRDKIGVTFGRKWTRSGGKALDFYASLVVYLAHLETVSRTIGNIKRATGIRIKLKTEKNKIVSAPRECEVLIRHRYGMDDMESALNWLADAKMLDKVGQDDKSVAKYFKSCQEMNQADYDENMKLIRDAVLVAWDEIEQRFAPTRRKYA